MSAPQSIRDHIRAAAARFVRAGLAAADASFDADLLARTALGWDRATLLTRADEAPPGSFAARYEALVARRERREPAAQIVGFREFWGRPFAVTRDVLVPRPETELIVDEALHFLGTLAPGSKPAVVDVGTGSGCLAVTLALERGLSVIATDISPRALQVAHDNATRLGAASRVTFVRTHLLDGLGRRFDVIVANPPYVRLPDREALSPEVREHEPPEALFGGPDGLDVIRTLLDSVADHLAPGGRLFMEFGAGQDDRVAALVTERPRLHLLGIREDLLGIPRMAVVGSL